MHPYTRSPRPSNPGRLLRSNVSRSYMFRSRTCLNCSGNSRWWRMFDDIPTIPNFCAVVYHRMRAYPCLRTMITIENMAEGTVKNSTDKRSELEEREIQMRLELLKMYPFSDLKMKDTRILNEVRSRKKCDFCYKSRKFFCYTCYHPVISCCYFPRVKVLIAMDTTKLSCD